MGIEMGKNVFDELFATLSRITSKYTIREKLSLLEKAENESGLTLGNSVQTFSESCHWREIMQFVPEGYRLDVLARAIKLAERRKP